MFADGTLVCPLLATELVRLIRKTGQLLRLPLSLQNEEPCYPRFMCSSALVPLIDTGGAGALYKVTSRSPIKRFLAARAAFQRLPCAGNASPRGLHKVVEAERAWCFAAHNPGTIVFIYVCSRDRMGVEPAEFFYIGCVLVFESAVGVVRGWEDRSIREVQVRPQARVA